ncbi:MAG: methyl-accepting chemotaxis protein [Methylobacterium sp.]|nr:MAG: methyl-accepting chemotaxis protein [Methylobacterium sp.]
MIKFSDLSTGLKVLIAPLVAICAFLGIGLMAFQLYTTIRDNNARVAEAANLKLEATQAARTFQEGVASFYRGISWTYSKVEQKLVDAELERGKKGVAEIEKSLLATRTGDDAKSAGTIRDLGPRIKALTTSLDNVASLIAVDPFLASMQMSDVNVRVKEIEAGLATLAEITGQRMAELRAQTDLSAEEAIRNFLVASAVAILSALMLAIFVGRMIARPIVGITRAMRQIAEGDLETQIPVENRRDEIGAMATALAVFKDNALQMRTIEAEQAEAQRKAGETRRAEMMKMADQFETAVGSVVAVVASAAAELQQSAQVLSVNAEETVGQSTAVAAATEQATTNVQTVAVSAEQLYGSIAEIAGQVGKSSSIAGQAVEQARVTEGTIRNLSEAAEKIGTVVEIISSIAAQTNLLALNATIEAARAGEAGRGFAVVASEVKDLAAQTAKATSEIASQIGFIQGATQQSTEAIASIGRTIDDMSGIALSIASAIEEQRTVTQDISRNAQEAAAGTQEVARNITQVNGAMTETGTAANQLLGASSELATQSTALHSKVSEFLDRVRAG